MTVLATYLTHVGLTVTLEQDGASFLTAITGDRKKPLYEGEDKAEAQAVFDAVKEHYEQRAFAVAKGTTPEEKESLEREAGLVKTAGATWKQEWEKQRAEVDKTLDRNQPK